MVMVYLGGKFVLWEGSSREGRTQRVEWTAEVERVGEKKRYAAAAT
jgi:hypothetical protein